MSDCARRWRWTGADGFHGVPADWETVREIGGVSTEAGRWASGLRVRTSGRSRAGQANPFDWVCEFSSSREQLGVSAIFFT